MGATTTLKPIINTIARRVLAFSIVLVTMTSIAAPAVQDDDEYAKWPRAEKPFWNPHKAPKSLCDSKKEIVSYTCELVNKKMVSICASRNLAPGTGYIVYRYGQPGNIELSYPKELQNTTGLFFYSNRWAQLDGQTSLSFFNKPYRYTVFNHWFVKDKHTVYRTGISVRFRNKIVFQKMCLGNLYYTTGRALFENSKSILHQYGTNFVFDFPTGLGLKTDEFIDIHVAKEDRN